MPGKEKKKKARLGFIGAGWWATSNHMPVLAQRDDVEMVAVCRLGVDELQRVKTEFGFEHATEDFRKLLEIPDLDGIVVSSPHGMHHEHALAALDRGLHVMCEKPLATSARDARELVRAADSRGLHLLIPNGWHHTPYVQEARERLRDGAVGEIEFVQCHMASPLRELLTGGRFDYTMGDMFMAPESSTWADPEVAGGGYGLSQMPHSVALTFWLTGLQPKRVAALTTAPGSRVELYDALTVEFEGGVIGSFSGAGTIPSDRGFQLDIRIFGTDGVLSLDFERARLQVLRNDGDHYESQLEAGAGAYACNGPPNNFVALIIGKTDENITPGAVGMRAIEMMDAAYRSAATGRFADV